MSDASRAWEALRVALDADRDRCKRIGPGVWDVADVMAVVKEWFLGSFAEASLGFISYSAGGWLSRAEITKRLRERARAMRYDGANWTQEEVLLAVADEIERGE